MAGPPKGAQVPKRWLLGGHCGEILNQNGSQGALWEPVGATIALKSAKSDPLSGSGKEKVIK